MTVIFSGVNLKFKTQSNQTAVPYRGCFFSFTHGKLVVQVLSIFSGFFSDYLLQLRFFGIG